ncbi:MAG: hypothetical protein NTV34_19785 [Proteobacteria bacterium]|nr:hypothetical protein [Pseudomonadota bacterium]
MLAVWSIATERRRLPRWDAAETTIDAKASVPGQCQFQAIVVLSLPKVTRVPTDTQDVWLLER